MWATDSEGTHFHWTQDRDTCLQARRLINIAPSNEVLINSINGGNQGWWNSGLKCPSQFLSYRQGLKYIVLYFLFLSNQKLFLRPSAQKYLPDKQHKEAEVCVLRGHPPQTQIISPQLG